MAILSFGGINKSLFSTGRKTSLASKTIKNISNVLSNKTSSKKNISNNILRFKSRRIENERRMQAQSELFASSQVRTPGGARRLALSGVGGSFLSRIMEFGAFMTAGWILTNMPTWTAGANELSNRIQSLNSTFTGFVDNIWDMMADIGRISGALFENMKAFDLTDSSYRVRNSMSGLINTLDSMGDQIKEAFSVITEPFMNVPPLGSKGDDGAYPDVPAAEPSGEPSGQPPASSGGGGGGGYKPILDLIAKYEAGSGGWESMYPRTRLPGATRMTISEVAKRATGAVGMYQNLPEHLVGRAKAVGLNPDKDLYNENNQRKIAVYLIEKGQAGVTPEMIKNNPDEAMVRLSRVWAAIPVPKDMQGHRRRVRKGESYYAGVGSNKAHITPEMMYQAMGASTKIQQSSPQQSSQQPSSQQQSQRQPSAQVSSRSSGSGGAIFGATGNVSNVPGWVHGHFQTNSGTVNDVVNDTAPIVKGLLDSGVIPELSRGQKFSKDMSMGEIKKLIRLGLTQHGHSGDGRSVDIFVPKGTKVPFPLYDVRAAEKRSGVSGILPGTGRVWVGHLDPKSKSGGQKPQIESSPSTPLVPSSTPSTPQTPSEVQIESPETGYDLLSEILLNANLTANRQDIVLINDLQPATTQMSGGSGGSSLSMRISESDIVNSFIKSKLLLDLNYL